METELTVADSAIRRAAALLSAGELVAFPTETVYGLGADARLDSAVLKIYAAKGRPVGNPIIVHVRGVGDARGYAAKWPDAAERLARKFWPGPLTIIVPRGTGISALVSAGRPTVALRAPDHPVAQELLRQFGGPIAAPSANRSGFTSPTTAQHVLAELAGRVERILDGGACAIGLESTVVDVSDESGPARILRPGAITAEMVREVLGDVETLSATVGVEEAAESPGQHSRHYAPRTPAFGFLRSEWDAVREWANTLAPPTGGPVALITWADDIFLPAPQETIRLSADPAEYGRTVYAALREADEKMPAAILVLLPESRSGLWAAITDRLRRATAPWQSLAQGQQ